MLHTILDYEIFEGFTLNQPKPVPIGTDEENKEWTSFWEYLRKGTDLSIVNYKNEENIFLNSLTTGRRGTKISTSVSFKKPYKQVLPKDTSPWSTYFIIENDEIIKQNYRKKNGLLFGFQADYKQIWNQLSLINLPKVLSVRECSELQFNSWNQIEPYMTPFSDIVIMDNYILDENLWESNLISILKVLKKATPIKFNLLIITFEGDKFKLDINISNKLKELLIDNKIICNLGIVLFTREFKEHDRGIFTNYLRIKSGDSFNYFDSKGNIITKGTDIDFYSMVENDKYIVTKNLLESVSKKISEIEGHDRSKFVYGDLNCNLIKL
jgi:hypothetical protein